MGRDLWRLMIYEWLITLKKSSGIYLMCELANVLLLQSDLVLALYRQEKW